MNHAPEQAIDFSDVFCYARGMANNDTSMVTIPDERIIRKIYLIRGKKVMFDQHLADLYDVEPRVLVQAVKRNLDRFPQDFMFQLSDSEAQTGLNRGMFGVRVYLVHGIYTYSEHTPCWRTQKCQKLCVPHAFLEGKKAGETFPKSTLRTLKGVRQQYPSLFCDSVLLTFGLPCGVWGVDSPPRQGYNVSVITAPCESYAWIGGKTVRKPHHYRVIRVP